MSDTSEEIKQLTKQLKDSRAREDGMDVLLICSELKVDLLKKELAAANKEIERLQSQGGKESKT